MRRFHGIWVGLFGLAMAGGCAEANRTLRQMQSAEQECWHACDRARSPCGPEPTMGCMMERETCLQHCPPAPPQER